jgi:hypothetical protein
VKDVKITLKKHIFCINFFYREIMENGIIWSNLVEKIHHSTNFGQNGEQM